MRLIEILFTTIIVAVLIVMLSSILVKKQTQTEIKINNLENKIEYLETTINNLER